MKLYIFFYLTLCLHLLAIEPGDFYSRGRTKVDRLYQLNTRDKYIVLTIDDGPSNYTDEILSILNKNNIKATFFLVGSEIESYPHMIRRISEEGHEIGIHSYTHRDFQKMTSEEMYIDEILAFNSILEKNHGTPAALVRPPYGSITPVQVEYLKRRGFFIINWSLDTFDWKYEWQDSLEVVKKKHHSGAILLTHSNKRAPYFLPELIRELKSGGYTFITISDFLNQNLPESPAAPDERGLWEKRREFLKGSIIK